MKIIEEAKNRFGRRAFLFLIGIGVYLIAAITNVIYQVAKGSPERIISSSPGLELVWIGLFLLVVMAVIVICLWINEKRGFLKKKGW